jgi:hypothetical protein
VPGDATAPANNIRTSQVLGHQSCRRTEAALEFYRYKPLILRAEIIKETHFRRAGSIKMTALTARTVKKYGVAGSEECSEEVKQMPTVRSRLLFLLIAVLILAVPATSPAAVFVSVSIAPPLLPVYAQPVCPGDGYIWIPGNWAYGPGGYYWVPGTWVLAPFVGALWTPGYWAWGGSGYFWNAGYWSFGVGFYGGINYGFGYFGSGYVGGYWNRGAFYYNRAVNHVNVTNVHNFYNRTVGNNKVRRVSYNGGVGGTVARPTRAELAVARGRRSPPTAAQKRLQQTASSSRAQAARVHPPVTPGRAGMAAMPRTGTASRMVQPPRNAAPASRTNSYVARAPHVAPRPLQQNTRSVPATRPRASAPLRQVHSNVRNAPAVHSAPTSQRSAPQARYSPRSVAGPRPSEPRAHAMAPPGPLPAQRPGHVPASTAARNQSQSGPRSHFAQPALRGGEKPRG